MRNISETDLTIVMPCYNENSRGVFKDRLNKLIQYMYEQTNLVYELILVNDGSTDDTLKVMQEFSSQYLNIRVVTYFPNIGKSYAVKKGLEIAEGRVSLMLDADLSVPLSNISKFYTYSIKYNVIVGVRQREEVNRGIVRNTISKLSHTVTRLLLGIKIKDTQCGFKMFDTQLIQSVLPYVKSKRWLIDIELILYTQAHKTTKIKEVSLIDNQVLQSTLRSKEALKSSIKELFIILANKHNTIASIKNK